VSQVKGKMRKGKVKWFSPEKGFGFIRVDPDIEAFVHYSEIDCDGYRMLHEEELVEFDLVESKRGYEAKNVRRIGKQESEEGS